MKIIIFLFLIFQTLKLQAQIRIIETNAKASFRAMSVVDDRVVWLAGTEGTIGRSINGGTSWSFSSIPGFEKSDFRSLYAFDSLHAIAANAGSPAVILRTEDGGKSWKEVYRNTHKDAFLDGVDFWDEMRGMVYGDPIQGKMLLLKTSDAGRTWLEVPEIQRPKLDSGEASFAASGTNIRLWEKSKVAIASGGMKSRIWYSENEGKTWNKIPVPILQGTDSQGIFSLFIHDQNWLVVGGDYKSDTLKKDHVFLSSDAGKTWVFPQKPTGGYRECITKTTENSFLAAGPSGVDLSQDGGKNWTLISEQKGFHVAKKARQGKLLMLAGAKGLIGIFE
jgi:photosystem II stability/assembly factor-like uncharacterized protein